MLHGVVGKGRPQTLRFVVIKVVKDTFIAINISRDVGEKDFIMAFRAEQEGQYSNLVGARLLITSHILLHFSHSIGTGSGVCGPSEKRSVFACCTPNMYGWPAAIQDIGLDSYPKELTLLLS